MPPTGHAVCPELLLPGDATVGSAMVRRPKTCAVDTSVALVREQFRDDHVHAVLVVDGERLISVVERDDLTAVRPGVPACETGMLTGRTVGPEADLADTWAAMGAAPRRRLAVVDARNVLLGLLCLKRTARGFCTDADVAARAADRIRPV